MTATNVYNRLEAIVLDGGWPKIMRWNTGTTEADYPVEVVRVGFLKPWFWVAETESPHQLFTRHWQDKSLLRSEKSRYQALSNTFDHESLCQLTQRVFKRPRREPGEYDLYVLVQVGWSWVGIKAHLVET